jgi:hypothetical protein
MPVVLYLILKACTRPLIQLLNNFQSLSYDFQLVKPCIGSDHDLLLDLHDPKPNGGLPRSIQKGTTTNRPVLTSEKVYMYLSILYRWTAGCLIYRRFSFYANTYNSNIRKAPPGRAGRLGVTRDSDLDSTLSRDSTEPLLATRLFGRVTHLTSDDTTKPPVLLKHARQHSNVATKDFT